MKKILVIGVCLLCVFAVSAQSYQKYAPYVNVGTSIQNNTLTYGGELGVYNNNSWYAAGISTTDVKGENYWTTSAKGYWKISNRRNHQLVDVFASGAVNMTLTKEHFLSVEPGLAAVYNLTKHWAPQVSLTFPIEQNAVFRERPLGISAGLSLNYFF